MRGYPVVHETGFSLCHQQEFLSISTWRKQSWDICYLSRQNEGFRNSNFFWG